MNLCPILMAAVCAHARAHGWTFGGPHSGHLVGEFPHELIDTARRNRNPAVRKQAVFWLGQSSDPRALTFFEEVLKP